MSVEDMTFGIEIECVIPQAAGIRIGRYHAGIQIPALDRGWNSQSDCSIRVDNGEFTSAEIVSPILKGAAGLASVVKTVAYLNSIGAKVNDSCGFHVHIGVNKSDSDKMRRITTLVSNFEDAIYAASGSRERYNGRFCHSVRALGSFRNCLHADRYQILNLTSPETVEFRAFSGTVQLTKMVAYVCLCLGIVERGESVKRATSWEAKPVKNTSPIARKGAGATALCRLFYQLGWIRGRQSRTFGYIENPSVSLKECKTELMRLARKYDKSAT